MPKRRDDLDPFHAHVNPSPEVEPGALFLLEYQPDRCGGVQSSVARNRQISGNHSSHTSFALRCPLLHLRIARRFSQIELELRRAPNSRSCQRIDCRERSRRLTLREKK